MTANPLPAEPVGGWQPIETAPKDGAYVLLRFQGPFIDRESPGIAVGRHYDDSSPHWWVTCAWAATRPHSEPTHWLPLPAPPSPSKPKSPCEGDLKPC